MFVARDIARIQERCLQLALWACLWKQFPRPYMNSQSTEGRDWVVSRVMVLKTSCPARIRLSSTWTPKMRKAAVQNYYDFGGLGNICVF